MKFTSIFLTIFLCIISHGTNAATLSSSVDRFSIGEDESLTLSISYDDAGVSGKPNLAGLENIFDITDSSSSSKTSIMNGSITSSKTWRYTLIPKKTGKFFIPSFSLNNSYSEPIEIEVLDNTAIRGSQSANRGDLFVQATVNKHEAYVQEMITLTLRIYTSVQIAQPKLPELNLPGFMVEKIGESQFETRESDRNYYVLEYRYALFAQQSGDLGIPKQRYQIAQVISNGPRSLFNIPEFGTQTQARFLSTSDIPIRIKAAPPDSPVDYWLAGDDVSLMDNWTDVQHAEVGTPVTRTIEIKVLGNLAANIPPLSEQTTNDLKIYREQAVLANSRAGDNLLATRTESMAIVAVAAGHYTLPEIRLHWWSNKEKQFKISILPQRSLTVNANLSTTTDNSTTKVQDSNNSMASMEKMNVEDTPATATTINQPLYLNVYLWMGMALILLFMWLLTMIFFVKKNRSASLITHSVKTSSHKISINELMQACRSNDPKQVRSTLIAWAEQRWPKEDLITLQDIKHKIDNRAFSALINELDMVLYRDASFWNGKPLLDLLQSSDIFSCNQDASNKTDKGVLPDLYR